VKSNQIFDIILKVLTLILCILFLLQIVFSNGLTNCDKCRFEYKGDIIRANNLLSIYEDTCFKEEINSTLYLQSIP
jgi:hypothetical protein